MTELRKLLIALDCFVTQLAYDLFWFECIDRIKNQVELLLKVFSQGLKVFSQCISLSTLLSFLKKIWQFFEALLQSHLEGLQSWTGWQEGWDYMLNVLQLSVEAIDQLWVYIFDRLPLLLDVLQKVVEVLKWIWEGLNLL